MADSSSEMTSPPETNSKVGRVMQKYGETDLGDELEARWNGDGVERSSLRELAAYFNRRILKAAMESAGVSVTNHDVEHVYTILTDPQVSSGSQVQKRRELERQGIEVEDLEDDFVSHQSIHTYLREYRNASYEREDDQDRLEKSRETIQRLRSRTTKVTEKTIRRLASAEKITIGNFDVFVDIRIHCQDCGDDYDIVELIENRGCSCRVE